MTRKHLLSLVAAGLAGLAACSSDPVSPDNDSLFESDVVDLVPDYAISSAAEIDGAGIGAALLPDELKLTPEQKATIAALHQAFIEEHADEVAALRELERQLRALRQSGGSREEARAILAEARGILQGLADDFAALQEAIWAVYTPEQRAWIEAHRPRICGPGGPPRLTEAQIAEIRALREAFHAAVADDIAFIQQVHQEARAAHHAGASAEEVRAILATAHDALERVRAAERQLHQDILDVLTPEQRAAWCLVRRHVAPRSLP
ncbi:MAG TPA: Spy/CpxP family protein refolding chaperone [Gemmatimonadaceae bacterium]|nr:Spy/CpxP family protein refolding chaperone [Gemmatimonadaceae bacterium]